MVAGSLCNKDAVVGQQKPEAVADTVFEMLLDDALKCLYFHSRFACTVLTACVKIFEIFYVQC